MPNLGQGAGWTPRQWRAARVRWVRLTDLIAINRDGYLNERHVRRYLLSGGGELFVVEHRGRLYVADGHHRATAAWRQGSTHVKARVITVP
jgi:hypothetical protein